MLKVIVEHSCHKSAQINMCAWEYKYIYIYIYIYIERERERQRERERERERERGREGEIERVKTTDKEIEWKLRITKL